jgi:hypothetical protein
MNYNSLDTFYGTYQQHPILLSDFPFQHVGQYFPKTMGYFCGFGNSQQDMLNSLNSHYRPSISFDSLSN